MIKLMAPALGISCICALEGYALSRGINGVALTASVGAICTIVGWSLGRAQDAPRLAQKEKGGQDRSDPLPPP